MAGRTERGQTGGLVERLPRAAEFISVAAVALLLSAAGLSALEADPAANLTISGEVNGSVLSLGASSRFAGAISSLVWRGKEFLNSFDHGREMQSAASYDGYGECLNPTEAGSEKDGTGPTSSSRVLHSAGVGRKLDATVQMAYWLTPGESYAGACGSWAGVHAAQNKTVLSPDSVRMQAQIMSGRGEAGVIRIDIAFTTSQDHHSATFEALTGYMPPEFSEFHAYNAATSSLLPLSDGPGEQPHPIIFSTPDHQFALGIFSSGLPQRRYPDAGYGRWRFALDTVKWNAVYRESPVPRGTYRYRCYVAVGTMDDVRATLSSLAMASGSNTVPR